jgi:hypothetical protein
MKRAARTRYGDALLVYEEIAITAPAEVTKAADEALVAAGGVDASDPDSHLKYSAEVEVLRDLMRKDLSQYQSN